MKLLPCVCAAALVSGSGQAVVDCFKTNNALCSEIVVSGPKPHRTRTCTYWVPPDPSDPESIGHLAQRRCPDTSIVDPAATWVEVVATGGRRSIMNQPETCVVTWLDWTCSEDGACIPLPNPNGLPSSNFAHPWRENYVSDPC